MRKADIQLLLKIYCLRKRKTNWILLLIYRDWLVFMKLNLKQIWINVIKRRMWYTRKIQMIQLPCFLHQCSKASSIFLPSSILPLLQSLIHSLPLSFTPSFFSHALILAIFKMPFKSPPLTPFPKTCFSLIGFTSSTIKEVRM